MGYEQINPRIIASIRRYADEHCPTGHFVGAVLSNNLVGACARADNDNIRVIPEIVKYVYNEIPGSCWGSPEKVKAWLEARPSCHVCHGEHPDRDEKRQEYIQDAREIIRAYREEKGRV